MRYIAQAVKIKPDNEGRLPLPEMALNVVGKGQMLIFTNRLTDQQLFDVKQLNAALDKLRYLRQMGEAKAKAEAARKAAEAKIKVVEEELARLRALLASQDDG